jgi:hypothetical protein
MATTLIAARTREKPNQERDLTDNIGAKTAANWREPTRSEATLVGHKGQQETQTKSGP